MTALIVAFVLGIGATLLALFLIHTTRAHKMNMQALAQVDERTRKASARTSELEAQLDSEQVTR
jgi:hypothetical protein